MKTRFEDAHRRRYGFVMPWKALVIEGRLGRGDRLDGGDRQSLRGGRRRRASEGRSWAGGGPEFGPDPGPSPGPSPGPGPGAGPAARAGRAGSRHGSTAGSGRRPSIGARRSAWAPPWTAPPSSSSPPRPPWWSPAGGRPLAASGDLVLRADRSPPARIGGRHRLRPGHAGGLQQPLHVDRRADGAHPREHRPLGQHQGAARLLLRALRPRRDARRQRAAHPDPPRIDERERAHRGAGEPGANEAGRRLLRERALQRRHPSPGRDGHHPGVRGPRLLRGGSRRRSQDAGPRSAHPLLRREPRPPRGHRRLHAGFDAPRRAHGGGGGGPLRQLHARGRGAGSWRRICAPTSGRDGGRPAIRTRTSPTSRPRSRPARRGSRRCAG